MQSTWLTLSFTWTSIIKVMNFNVLYVINYEKHSFILNKEIDSVTD